MEPVVIAHVSFFFIGAVFGAIMGYKLSDLSIKRKKLRISAAIKEIGQKMEESLEQQFKGLTAQECLLSSEEITEMERIVGPKLAEVQDIMEEMTELYAVLDQPSKNQGHSLYKNSVVRHIKELNTKRIEILREVLAAGFNPPVMAFDGEKNYKTDLRSIVEESEAIAAEDNEPIIEQSKIEKSGLRLIKTEDLEDEQNEQGGDE